jgi:dephospho-CoA kinase
VGPDGELDRPALATIVFADERARRDLEAIVHPEVRRLVEAGIAANTDTDRIVVIESPLLIETGMDRICDVVVVVAARPDARVERLMARGMDEEDARARMATQGSLEAALGAADVVLDNDGTPSELEAQVGRLWAGLLARAGGGG